MASHSSLLILLLPSLLLSPGTALVQINKILSQFPEFSSFNNYLNQTNLTTAIDVRQTITVLTVDNSVASALSSQPADALKNLLSVHVILDYYDDTKLQNLPNKTALLTTLFQTSGEAVGQTGFLNATVTSSGQVAFGSAVPGSNLSSDLVKVVVTHPYNISVLQISSLIVPPGVGAGAGSLNHSVSPTPSLAPNTAPTPATAPSPSSKGGTVIPVKPGSPAKSPSNSDAPSPATKARKAASPAANAPAPSDDSLAGGPESDAPGAPESDAPGASPPSPPAPPRARPPASAIADAPGKGGHSGSTRVVAGRGLVVAVGVAFLACL